MREKPIRRLLLLVAAPTIALAAAVMLHLPYVNGSPYWVWPWRDTALLPSTRWYPPMLLAAAPIITAIAWLTFRSTRSATASLPTSPTPRRPDGAAAGASRSISPRRLERFAIVALCMIGVIAMKLTSLAIVARPASFELMEAIVRSPSATSYYTDAAAIDRAAPSGWLAIYPELLPRTNLHTQSKPPGAVAYWLACIRLFGYGRASAVAGAIGLAIIASFSIPATMWLTRMLTGSSQIALLAAMMLAVCPGFVLIFPTFDACYPILTAGLIGLWHLAITRGNTSGGRGEDGRRGNGARDDGGRDDGARGGDGGRGGGGRGDWRFAAAFGLLLALTCFLTYNLLVLGVFLAAWPFAILDGSAKTKSARVARLSIVAIASVAAFYIVLAIFTQFDPIATFRSAWRNQHALLAAHREDRPYPMTIGFDLLDFALGAGWLAAILAIAAVANLATFRRSTGAIPIGTASIGTASIETAPTGTAPIGTRSTDTTPIDTSSIGTAPATRRLVMLCLAQPLIVAIAGILQSETARAWNFMLPLLLIPAAIELSRWPAAPRGVTLALMLALMLLIGHHMVFMVP